MSRNQYSIVSLIELIIDKTDSQLSPVLCNLIYIASVSCDVTAEPLIEEHEAKFTALLITLPHHRPTPSHPVHSEKKKHSGEKIINFFFFAQEVLMSITPSNKVLSVQFTLGGRTRGQSRVCRRDLQILGFSLRQKTFVSSLY